MLIVIVRTSRNIITNTNKPGESGGQLAALTVVVLYSLGSPAEIISSWMKGASIVGSASTAAAGQTVNPGEEVLLKPPEQLQHQEIILSKFTFYKESNRSGVSSESSFKKEHVFKSKWRYTTDSIEYVNVTCT